MLKLPESESSYWQRFSKGMQYPQLTQDHQADVVIVGAGITGLTSAYLLKKAGLKVIVIDKSTVGGGTTGRTTGKVTSQHNLVYADMAKRLGTSTAKIYGQANQAAIDQIETIITAEGIDCEWERQDNYVYTTDPSQVSTFQKEATAAQSLGLPASFETKTTLPFDVKAAVKFSNQAQFNSQKYLLGLAKAVNGDGSFVFENSTVIGIRDGRTCQIRTTKAKVRAKHIIVATNVPASPLMARGSYCTLEYPKESYIVAGKLPDDFDGMYISPDSQNYSLLPVKIEGQSVLLVGGEGHVSGLRGSRRAHWQHLADYAQEHFGVTEIINRWSDRDYLSYDGIPLIGKLYPWSKNTYVGTAFMKWGLSNGTVAAMILSDMIIGTPNPWAQTFDSNRLRPVRYFPKAVAENVKELFQKNFTSRKT